MSKLVHPYGELTGGEWIRGNLHTHSTQSDGSRSPQEVIDDYASRGYGFLMLSDHDVYTSEEDYRQWNSRGLVLIPGNELAAGPHLLHVDADRRVLSRPSRQEMMNEIAAASAGTGRGFCIVNHPNWESRFDHCTIEQMREWTGYLGMEIYNGVIGRLDGDPYALDKWDMLLSGGRRVWGFANDDCHHAPDAGQGWNVAYVRERSRQAVVDALRAGRFYCSTGVVIRSIRVEGSTVRVEAENAERIVAKRDVGRRFAVVDGPVLEVEAPTGARYIRFECWGRGERFAWTQPFYLENEADGDVEVPYLRDWQVSDLLEHGTLESASPAEAAARKTTAARSYGAKGAIPGFLDLREQIQRRDGIVYAASDIESPADGQGLLSLGYDGPLRVWLNDQQVFCGPGANPAVADRVRLYAPFRRGRNRLLIAFATNRGKAWGVFANAIPPR